MIVHKGLTYLSSTLFLVLLVMLLSNTSASAQTFSIKGKVLDNSDNTTLPGAIIRLINESDTTKIIGTTTDVDGLYEIANVIPAMYKLTIDYISYKTVNQLITLKDADVTIPDIKLQASTKQLKEVMVEAQQVRVEQKGDTTQFNAGAYKTNPDATTEDLVKKMPGVTVDGTTVKVNGEEVKKVFVDGKPFFGDDPSATLKNFPADMVDKIQVFDKASDQAQFTGFKDGDEEKTINIITKGSKKEGQFGKLYAGYGTDDRYNGGLAYNYFNGNRRVSVLGMLNNINQQNFSISDIMSVMGSSGSQGGRGGNGGGGQGGGGASNFLSGQQNGITNTNAFGLNYSDKWGKKINVTGSYFFNQTINSNTSSIVRNYFTENKLVYEQTGQSKADNLNHKVNLKFEYNIDSSNALMITPRFTFQGNTASSDLSSGNRVFDSNSFLSTTLNNNDSKNKGYNFQNDLLFQHKFLKKGRTISLNVNTQLNDRNGDGNYYSSSLYNDTATISTILNQNYTTNTTGNTIGGNLTYTEPVGKNGQLSIAYRPSQTTSGTDKTTFTSNNSGASDILDTALSNKYNTTYTIQRGGLSYRITNQKYNFTVGADLQQADLKGSQTFPATSTIHKTFTNVLPMAMLNYKFSKSKNINVRYRTQTQSPSVTQLQNVIDVSNPLLVKSGNTNLKQSFENTLNMRIGLTNPIKVTSFSVFLMANQTNDYISNGTYILNNDTVLQGYTIKRGSQLTVPVNLNNYYSVRGFGVYSFPLSKIKSNFNLSFGYSYAHTPALINSRINYSDNNAISGGGTLSSNISESLDFSLSYNGSYNTVQNTIQTQSNSNYYNHTATLKANYILRKKIVFNTDVNQIMYKGLTQSYNQNFILWNAYVGYKFLKDQSLEAKVSVYDLLNQNRSVSRTITETYTEDSNTQVLKQYFMFTLTYTFKKFKNGAAPDPVKTDFPRGMPPPGMMGPPPGN